MLDDYDTAAPIHQVLPGPGRSLDPTLVPTGKFSKTKIPVETPSRNPWLPVVLSPCKGPRPSSQPVHKCRMNTCTWVQGEGGRGLERTQAWVKFLTVILSNLSSKLGLLICKNVLLKESPSQGWSEDLMRPETWTLL